MDWFCSLYMCIKHILMRFLNTDTPVKKQETDAKKEKALDTKRYKYSITLNVFKPIAAL